MITVTATDPDLPDDALVQALDVAPEGMTLAAGQLAWTPTLADVGRHDVTVGVTDLAGLSDSTSFVVSVRADNGPPVAVDDRYFTPRGRVTTIAAPGVLGNDVDPDGDTLAATLVSGPTLGALTLRADGGFDYRPGSPADEPLAATTRYRFEVTPDTNRPLYPRAQAVVGDVDGDGSPEIVARGQLSSGFANSGYLMLLRAHPGTPTLERVWQRHTWGDGDPGGIDDDVDYGATQPLLADLDHDGKLEIILASVSVGHVVIFDHQGEVLYGPSAGDPTLERRDDSGFWTVADLEGDRAPEILGVEPVGVAPAVTAHLVALDATGTQLWSTPLTADTVDRDTSVPVVAADLDLDGRLEIIFDRHVLDADGQLRWAAPAVAADLQSRTYPGVANFDDDAQGEVVLVSANRGVELREDDGTCIWRARGIPMNDGCPTRTVTPVGIPTGLAIVDLDDDAAVDIVTAGSTHGVLALRRDGSVLWQRASVDVGAGAITIDDLTTFDLDGDGVQEVIVVGNNVASSSVHGGVAFLDGRDGTTRATIHGDEHPGRDELTLTLADVDGDKAAELIVTTGLGLNGTGSPTGLWVYGSAGTPWDADAPDVEPVELRRQQRDGGGRRADPPRRQLAHPRPQQLPRQRAAARGGRRHRPLHVHRQRRSPHVRGGDGGARAAPPQRGARVRWPARGRGRRRLRLPTAPVCRRRRRGRRGDAVARGRARRHDARRRCAGVGDARGGPRVAPGRRHGA